MYFAAAITMYNPSMETIENINKYTSIFDKVYVFDNSEEPNEYSLDDKVIYISGNGNKGLSIAYNTMFSMIDSSSCDFVCMLDQDSSFDEKNINKMKSYIMSNKKLDNVMIISPFINYDSKNNIDYEEKIDEANWVIASGSFVNVKLLIESNIMFDEHYFIDRFDVDFCKQVKNLGYHIYIYYGSILNQNLGDGNKGINSNHSVFRHYYIFKSRRYFNKKWYNCVKALCLTGLQNVKHMLLIIKYENQKKEKLKMYFKAKKDFKLESVEGKLKNGK